MNIRRHDRHIIRSAPYWDVCSYATVTFSDGRPTVTNRIVIERFRSIREAVDRFGNLPVIG
jgi:hypothetical protein